MSETTLNPNAPKPKKSVALSGVVAGNSALCTVGRTGNDLHYRGYDILDIADVCEFEEVAHLLVHGHFPNREELKVDDLSEIRTKIIDAADKIRQNHLDGKCGDPNCACRFKSAR